MGGRLIDPRTGRPFDHGTTDPIGRPPTAAHAAMLKAQRADPMTAGVLGQLARYGISQRADGSFIVPEDAIHAMRDDRVRRSSVTQVPQVPRFLNRDGGGVGAAKGHSSAGELSMDALRRMRKRAQILAPIHSARHKQVRRYAVKWSGRRTDVGWRVIHKDHFDWKAQQPKGIEPYIKLFASMLERPHGRYCPTTGDLLVPLWEDLATLNRPVVEVLYSALDPNTVVGFQPVDAAMVWSTLSWLERWVGLNPRWAGSRSVDSMSDDQLLAFVSEIVGHDLVHADYCIVQDGELVSTVQPGTLIVAPMRNTTDVNAAGYPVSYVEEALELIAAFMNTFDYNANYFTQGMTTEFILGVKGGYSTRTIDAFVDLFREATRGVGRAWQVPILPLEDNGDLFKIPLKESNREMMFETWLSLLISLICGVYRMDPSTINAKPWEGGGGAALSAPNRNAEIEAAKGEGLLGDLTHLADSILTPLAQKLHPDLRVIFHDGTTDAGAEAEIQTKQVGVWRTPNEVRIENGARPIPPYIPDDQLQQKYESDRAAFDEHMANPYNWSQATGIVQAMNLRASQAAQQGDPNAMGGAPDDQPDGFGGGPGGAPGEADPEEDGDEVPRGNAPVGSQAPPRPGYGKVPDDMRKARGKMRVFTVDTE